jgi:hypothetical protein
LTRFEKWHDWVHEDCFEALWTANNVKL